MKFNRMGWKCVLDKFYNNFLYYAWEILALNRFISMWKQMFMDETRVHLFSLSFDEWNFSHFSFVLVSQLHRFSSSWVRCCASFSFISMDFGSRVFGRICYGRFCCCGVENSPFAAFTLFPKKIFNEEVHCKKRFLALTEVCLNTGPFVMFFSKITKELHWMAKIFGAFPNQDIIFAQQVGNFLIWMMEKRLILQTAWDFHATYTWMLLR